jgi:hypothetical protein
MTLLLKIYQFFFLEPFTAQHNWASFLSLLTCYYNGRIVIISRVVLQQGPYLPCECREHKAPGSENTRFVMNCKAKLYCPVCVGYVTLGFLHNKSKQKIYIHICICIYIKKFFLLLYLEGHSVHTCILFLAWIDRKI